MLGDHAERVVNGLVLSIRLAAQLRHAVDEGGHQVGAVDGGGALQDGSGAVQPHAGVDIGGGQGHAGPVLALVELHEHQVPKLDEPAGAVVRPLLLPKPDDALFGHAYVPAPMAEGFVVVRVDGYPEPLRRELQHGGGELPRPGDDLLLEVIADAEVAQHLEEGEVGVVSHGIDVGGAKALLGGNEPAAGRLLGAGEVGLEGHHAGAGEQQRGVACRHQRGAGHPQMATLLKEGEIGRADGVGADGALLGHGTSAPRRRGRHGKEVGSNRQKSRKGLSQCQSRPGRGKPARRVGQHQASRRLHSQLVGQRRSRMARHGYRAEGG